MADINAIMKPFTDYEKKPVSDGDAARKEELLDLINSAEKAKKALAKAVDDACKYIAKEVRAIHRKETRLPGVTQAEFTRFGAPCRMRYNTILPLGQRSC